MESSTLGITESSVPDWVKANAHWWSQGQISDAEFTTGIQYLIGEGIISVPELAVTGGSAESIPDWLRSNAEWWATGLITEADFVQGLQWLIINGIIILNQ